MRKLTDNNVDTGGLDIDDLEPIPKVVESDESFVIPCTAPESSTGGAEMWKPEHRRAAARHGLRYPSDLTDAERESVDVFPINEVCGLPQSSLWWFSSDSLMGAG